MFYLFIFFKVCSFFIFYVIYRKVDGLTSSASSVTNTRSPTLPISIGKSGISPNGNLNSSGSSNVIPIGSSRYAAQSAPAPKAPIIGSLPAPRGFADDMKQLSLPPASPAASPPKGSLSGSVSYFAIQ